MKILMSFLFISLLSCVPSKEIVFSESEYVLLPVNATLNKYVGKKVYFKAKICDFEMQHMLRLSIDGSNQHFCIDQINDSGKKTDFQLLAYTDESKMKEIKKYNGKTFTIYGTLESIGGVGKGGGEHTEYYLEFDKIQ